VISQRPTPLVDLCFRRIISFPEEWSWVSQNGSKDDMKPNGRNRGLRTLDIAIVLTRALKAMEIAISEAKPFYEYFKNRN